MSQMEILMSTVRILHTLPMTVNEVAETAARHRKAKYDMATPAAHEIMSAPTFLRFHRTVCSTCGSVASVMQSSITLDHRFV